MEYLKDKEEINDTKKILFTGLDTAGKSSIILALKREFSKIAIINPTKGAQRRIFEFLGLNISEWDLGGQSLYRISYLKNPDKYFDNTEVAIYIIDIQNQGRAQESISYLKDVLKEFKALKIDPPVHIFFHKFDPALNVKARNKMKDYISDIKSQLKEELSYDKLYYHKTSIYNIASLIEAISKILIGLFPRSQLLKDTIEEFARKLNCEGLLIVDRNTFIIGSFFKNSKIKTLMVNSIPYFMTLSDILLDSKIVEINEEDQILVEKVNEHIIFRRLLMRESSPQYYLLLLKKGQYFYKEGDFEALINLISNIIYE
ncbi:MAG: hypothetical protein GF317_12340 [Candidatus Lokiarchaeota archaeon]|nr:hypothetical protein [Candidatus Lokiarchaeota archaeon]MBD3200437.1 hypothetical protein [Candidatus Lokiarchaeota archaeon]